MKLKQQPEDFQVEELTSVVPTGRGEFALYRLEKRGWSTPDALAAVRRRWQIDLSRMSYGGLKDRHAQTVQYLSLHRGPRRGLQHQGIRVEYLGQIGRPYSSQDIRANRFQIQLRDLDAGAVARAEAALHEVRADGVPNYFDDQRFGSVAGDAGDAGEFIARLMVFGRFEEALRLALTGPYEYDRAEEKKAKTFLRSHWGDWEACKQGLSRGHARSLVDYLRSHPTDFRGALERLRPELRGLYLSAYQSHLWNRVLARWLTDRLRPDQLVAVRLRLGEVPFPRGLDESQRRELSALSLPLPSARCKLAPDDPRLPAVEAVLAQDGLRPEQMKVKGSRDLFFSRGERAALVAPEGLGHAVGADENHPGRSKLALAFDLPRGAYATLIVKRVAPSEPEA